MSPHVLVRIQLGPWPDDSDKSVVVPLAEYVVREALERLDYATPDAPVAVKMFITTPPRQIKETQLMRRMLADVVAGAVKAKVLEMLGEHDTVMGYAAPSCIHRSGCDTPSYCTSVRRCTARDSDNGAAPQEIADVGA